MINGYALKILIPHSLREVDNWLKRKIAMSSGLALVLDYYISSFAF